MPDEVVAAQAPTPQIIQVNIPFPPPMDLKGNVATNWRRFKRAWDNYEIAARLKDQPNELRTATFLTCIGADMMEVYEGLAFASDAEKNNIAVVCKKLEDFCIGETNEIYERYCFNKRAQESTETIDAYVSALRCLAKSCNYGTLEDDMIRDRIVIGIIDNGTRKRLLQEAKLTLKSCVDICRASESTAQQLKAMTSEDVHVISKDVRQKTSQTQRHKPNREKDTPKRYDRGKSSSSANSGPGYIRDCRFCGRNHPRAKCPAYGEECKICHAKNHFAVKCYQAGSVHMLEDNSSGEEYIDYLCTATHTIDSLHSVDDCFPKKVFATMSIGDEIVKFQVDSGATTNTLPIGAYAKALHDPELTKVSPSTTKLVTYNNSVVPSLGKCRTRVTNPCNRKKYSVEFELTPNNFKPILGAKASQSMKLITVNFENIQALDNAARVTMHVDPIINRYNDVFEGQGKLAGTLHLETDKDVPPVQIPPRRLPLTKKTKVKDELSRLVDIGMITPVVEPTDWISPMLPITKKNGSIRLCIDPKPLNKALKRNHYPLPTIEDILPEIAKAKVFTVLDTKNGFWHVALDEASSMLTTFSTPWGRFRWQRMPFGISVAPEEFQRRLHIALEGLHGSKAIADDILVWGTGDTLAQAVLEHDQNLESVLARCRERGLKLNKSKIKLRQTVVPFMGHLFTADGLQADPGKVEAINKMPRPTDKQAVDRLLGMANYLHKFVPNMSQLTAPLRDLTKRDNEFVWDETVHGKCMDSLKEVLTQAPVLKYFDPACQDIVMQCDASSTGLGACLLQEGHPIAYASRALNSAERNYAQIEKELLAVVFGAEKFQEYVYGRKITVESDHRPLEAIYKKGLLNAPKRLQRMLLRLQRYDITLVYKKGSQMYLADTLSRAYLPGCAPPAEEESILTLDDSRSPTEIAVEEINVLQHVPLSEAALAKIQRATRQDSVLVDLMTRIHDGWPDTQTTIQQPLRDYFPYREELVTYNGLVLKGDRIVIPQSLQDEMTKKIHASHIGVQGCLRRAREALFWPGMNKVIADEVGRCDICQSSQAAQAKETMISHEISTRPWQKIGCDLFELYGKDYLISVDYYSSFFEVDLLQDKKADSVITVLKGHMARHGIPDQLISDNGPPFQSCDFQAFAQTYEFDHVTSSPGYPQSNGKAENAVKIAKNLLRKATDAKTDPFLALLSWRNTPSESMGSSPAQRLFSRRTKTLLPTASTLLRPKVVKDVQDKLHQSKAKQQAYYNRTAHELTNLNPGDRVRVNLSGNNKYDKWQKGQVDQQVDVRSYLVRTEDGRQYRRNRRHIRKTSSDIGTSSRVRPVIPKPQVAANSGISSGARPVIPKPLVAANPRPPAEMIPKEVPLNEVSPISEETGMQPDPIDPLLGETPRMTLRGRTVKPPAYLKNYVVS